MIRHLNGPAGRLEALLDEPTGCSSTGIARDAESIAKPSSITPRAAVVLAHPHPLYGGTMNTKVVYHVSKAFCRVDCAVLRFNFRGAGTSEGTFDHGVGEADDFRAAIDFVAGHYPGRPIWAAGVSFGAWVGLTTGAGDDRVSALIGVAPPLEMYDFEAVRRTNKPRFFIQGERDHLCPLPAMRRFYGSLEEPKELVVIDAADHLFDGKVSEVGDAIVDLFEGWPESSS